MDKHKLRRMVFTAVILMCGSACIRVPPTKGLTPTPSGLRWAEKTLNRMTIAEKVGQLIFCRYNGLFLNRDSDTFQKLASLITRDKIGGLILFGGDIYETAHLTNAFQNMASVPLLIAADLERGLGNQLDRAVLFPPLMSIGATRSEELARKMGEITAFEARAVGIHMTYAPVVDVNINPENPIINTRSIGEDPELVGRLASAFIRGCQDEGLIATAKHFPGHGDTSQDSHTVLPTVSGDRERLDRIELFPFKKTIEAGVKAVMTAHLWLPALDKTPNLPATLSRKVMTDLLRREMGFDGLIVTDAMEMGGITTLYPPEKAARMAIEAGVDLILLPPEPEQVIQALVDAVERGDIAESRIDASVRRVLIAKAGLGLHRKKLVDVSLLDKKIGRKDHWLQAQETFERSMTLVKNEGGLVPLAGEKQKLALFSLSSDPGGYFAGSAFLQEMRKLAPESIVFQAEPTTSSLLFDEALESAKEADVLVFALFSRLRSNKGSVDIHPQHVDFINRAAEGEKPVLVISFGSPYFYRHFPGVQAYLCAYRYAAEAQRAAARAIMGERDITGKLPVSIPGHFSFGHGISIKGR